MLRIHAYGKTSVVKHKSVLLNVNGGVWSNKLFGGRWQRLVDHMEIAEGQFLVFTNLGNYELKMSIFTCMGTCLHTEYVLPTMLITPPRAIPVYARYGMFHVTFDRVF